MRKFILVIVMLSTIPVSLAVMIYGWGLAPISWGWIAFGFLWTFTLPIITKILLES
jgi:hypothetical protein